MLKLYTYRNNPIFPYDCDMTRFGELTIRKVTKESGENYWEVTFNFNGDIKTDYFPIMTKGLWKLIWSHFRINL